MICLDNTDVLEGGASVDAVVHYTVHGLAAGAFTNLANGVLTNVDTTALYTAAAQIAIVSITLVNTHSAAVTVNLYLDPADAGTPRRLIPKDLSLGVGYCMVYDGSKLAVLDDNGNLMTAATAEAHAANHQNGGSDEVNVQGLSGLLADGQTPLGHAASHDGGADDLNGALTPNAHAASHQNAGGDEISVTGLSGTLADAQTPAAHKDAHDPENGGDPLDTAAAAEIAGVQAAGVGSAHTFARADHAHAINHGITDNHLVTMDQDPYADDNDYAKFTADGIEGRSYSEVRSDLDLEAGTDFPSLTTFEDHSTRHENGGGDEISVLGLSGLLADGQTPLAHAASHDGGADDLNGALTPNAHAAAHQNAGGDEISVAGLSGELADAQKVAVIKNSGAVVGTRTDLNFIEGANVTLTIADDAGNDQVDITIAAAGGGGGSALRRIILPAACFETRAAAGWAAFVQAQGANFDFGRLDFDKDTDEIAFSPPFVMENYDGTTNVTCKVYWKADTDAGVVRWIVSLLGRTDDEAWDAALTDLFTIEDTAGNVAEDIMIGSSAVDISGSITADDIVVLKISRDADHENDTLAVDAKLICVMIEYTEA